MGWGKAPSSLRVALRNSLQSPRAPQRCGSTLPQGNVGQGPRAAALQSCASPTQCLLQAAALPSIALLQAQHCCWGCWLQPPLPVPMDAGNCCRAHGKINELITSTELHRLAALPKALCAAHTPGPRFDPQPCSMRLGCHRSPLNPAPAPQFIPVPQPNLSAPLPAGC